ncbi:MAG: hypothetical protein R2706_18605 [Acidimicrobiales bacterium]
MTVKPVASSNLITLKGPTDGTDDPVVNGDIADKRWRTRSVDDSPASNHNLVWHSEHPLGRRRDTTAHQMTSNWSDTTRNSRSYLPPALRSASLTPMITTTLDISAKTSAAATGWEIKPEGACKGEVCVPLPDGYTAVNAAERLGMAIVADEASGLTAFGPESLSGRALVTAQAPEVVLPDLDGNDFHLSSCEARKSLSSPGPLLRLPL